MRSATSGPSCARAALVVLALVAAAAFQPAAGAQTPQDPSTTTTTTTTTTTVPPVPEPVPPSVPADGDAPAEPGEAEPPPPAPSVPRIDYPGYRPSTGPTGPVTAAMRPAAAATVRAEREAALARRDRARAAHDELERRHQLLVADVDTARGDQASSTAGLAQSRDELRDRAIAAFVAGGEPAATLAALDSETATDALAATVYASVAADSSRAAAERYTDLRDRASERERAAAATLADLTDERDAAAVELFYAQAALAQADLAVEALAQAQFVFPIDGDFNFVDTFGAPRATPVVWHHGTDIFAATGTPLVAVEDGVLDRVGENRLGGLRLWLIGASGNRYYYAHLAGFAPGITTGTPVTAGQHVGNTGDARTTPPHLHFELRLPGSDTPVNPYPFLRALATGAPVAASRAASAPQDLLPLFTAAAARYNVPVALLVEQARAESGFAPDVIACQRFSSAGARGISQFMPATAASMGVDPCNPASAIDGQARMMAGLHAQFGSWALALAAYNAGPGRVERCRCVPAITETVNYVAKVLAAAGMPPDAK